jgi:hypothetical protein
MRARPLRKAALAAGLLVLVATEARAQAPEEGPPVPVPPVGLTQIVVPEVVVPGSPASLWTFSLRAQEQWDSNFRLTTPAVETFSERLGLTLTHAKRSPRGTLALSADGWGALYHAASGLNGINGTAATSGTYELGPRTTFRAGATGSSVYAPESQALAAEGLILPLSRSQSISGTMGVLQRLGTRTVLSTDVRYDRFAFSRADDEEFPDPASPQGGSLLVFATALAPRLNQNDSLVLGYDFQRSETGGRHAGTHGLSLGWSRIIGRRLAASASAGVSRFQLVTDSTKGWAFRSAAGLSAVFRRSALDAQYTRSIDQAFGFGRDRLSDIVSAGYTVRASRRVRLRAGGVMGLTRDPRDPSFRFVTQTATGALSYTLGRRIDLVTAYDFSRNDPEAGLAVSRHVFGVSLGYTREWRP